GMARAEVRVLLRAADESDCRDKPTSHQNLPDHPMVASPEPVTEAVGPELDRVAIIQITPVTATTAPAPAVIRPGVLQSRVSKSLVVGSSWSAKYIPAPAPIATVPTTIIVIGSAREGR